MGSLHTRWWHDHSQTVSNSHDDVRIACFFCSFLTGQDTHSPRRFPVLFLPLFFFFFSVPSAQSRPFSVVAVALSHTLSLPVRQSRPKGTTPLSKFAIHGSQENFGYDRVCNDTRRAIDTAPMSRERFDHADVVRDLPDTVEMLMVAPDRDCRRRRRMHADTRSMGSRTQSDVLRGTKSARDHMTRSGQSGLFGCHLRQRPDTARASRSLNISGALSSSS